VSSFFSLDIELFYSYIARVNRKQAFNAMQETPSYYSIVPSSVRYDNELSSSEKLLYSEISALVNMNGTCFASNGYFARLYEVSERTVTRWITSLKDRGHIKVIKSDEHERIIELSWVDKNVYGGRQKCPRGVDKNVGHNTIENNTTTTRVRKSISTKGDSMVDMISSDLAFKSLSSLKGIKVSLGQFEAHRSEIRKPMTNQARKVMLGKLVKYQEQGYNVVEMLDTAVERGWLSVYPPKEKKGHSDAFNSLPVRGNLL